MKFNLVLIVWLACFSVWAQEISPRYELVKMNDKINTLYHQVSPVISIDGTKLYYFVSNHPQNTFGKENSQTSGFLHWIVRANGWKENV